MDGWLELLVGWYSVVVMSSGSKRLRLNNTTHNFSNTYSSDILSSLMLMSILESNLKNELLEINFLWRVAGLP